MPTSRRPTGAERQARLKPRFAELYPGVAAGEWMPAWLLAEQLVASASRREGDAAGRVFDPAHCEFRGGGRRPPELRGLRPRGGGGGTSTE
jgi:hypothetical protein